VLLISRKYCAKPRLDPFSCSCRIHECDSRPCHAIISHNRLHLALRRCSLNSFTKVYGLISASFGDQERGSGYPRTGILYVSVRAVQGLKGTDLQHDHRHYLGSGKNTPRFEATLCHFVFEIYPCCSGRSAVTFKVDAATSMRAPTPTPVQV